MQDVAALKWGMGGRKLETQDAGRKWDQAKGENSLKINPTSARYIWSHSGAVPLVSSLFLLSAIQLRMPRQP